MSTVPQSTQKGMLRTGESELGCICQGTTGLGRRGEGVSSVVDTGLEEKFGESSRKLPITGRVMRAARGLRDGSQFEYVEGYSKIPEYVK